MAIQEKQLGQTRPSGTTAVSIYSPASSTTTIVKAIYATNTTANDETFSIYHDDDGTTYDADSSLFNEITIKADETIEIYSYIAMNDSSGNLAVQTSTADAINFTVYGAEIT